MKHPFLLQEIIDDLVHTERSLSSPLMKLNYFAKLIKNQALTKGNIIARLSSIFESAFK